MHRDRIEHRAAGLVERAIPGEHRYKGGVGTTTGITPGAGGQTVRPAAGPAYGVKPFDEIKPPRPWAATPPLGPQRPQPNQPPWVPGQPAELGQSLAPTMGTFGGGQRPAFISGSLSEAPPYKPVTDSSQYSIIPRGGSETGPVPSPTGITPGAGGQTVRPAAGPAYGLGK